LFIAAAALLVVSLSVGGVVWYKKMNAIETQLAGIKAEQSQMLDRYSVLREQVNVRLGRGPDAHLFITPDEPAVAAKVREIAGDYSAERKEQWGDYERMYRWISMNIEYTRDTYTPVLPELMDGTLEWEEGFWKLPVETLSDEAGDCEDMCTLLASMILNYNERRFPVWLVGIRTPPPNAKGHVAIAFPVANKQLTILDPSAHYHSVHSIGWGLFAYDIPVTVDQWLARWEKKMPDAYVYMAVSEDVYAEFSSTDEFISWLNEYYGY